ncbi:SDR family NAD(P)-dependent oxidoreductase [Rhizobium sp.]
MVNDNGARVALVTGGASGLGAAIATALAREGYQLVVGDVDEVKGRAFTESLGNARFELLDVRSEHDWRRLGRALHDGYGGLDVLVNNAAVYSPKAITDETPQGFQRIFEVNQLSVLLGMQMAVPMMQARGGGSIVNISSTGGLRGYPGTIAYASTKWAVRGMSKVAAVELAPFGIRVNSVHPGLCETPMAYENTPELLDSLRASIPVGRLGEPSEVANAVVFLASPQSSYVSGTEIIVDGAATA